MDIGIGLSDDFISGGDGSIIARGEQRSSVSITAREAMPNSSLSLPVVLCIAIGGGLLIFLALGFLLIYILRRRDSAPATRHVVYSTAHPTQPTPPGTQSFASLTAAMHKFRRPSATRLVKKNAATCSRETLDRMGSREDMGDGDGAMGMMPDKYAFRGRSGSKASKGAMSRKGSVGVEGGRDWVEGHEPKTKRRSWRQSWEGWLRRTPTLPDVGAIEAGTGVKKEGVSPTNSLRISPKTSPQALREIQYAEQQRLQHMQQSTPTRGRPVTQIHQLGNTIQMQPQRFQIQRSQTAPSLSGGMPMNTGPKAPARVHYKQMRVRDADLHDILTMTERRLKEGSQSNTPRTSPSKVSPVKTPTSIRSRSGRLRNPTTPRSTGSPSKTIKLVQPSGTFDRARTSQTPGSAGRNASTSSIGSVARGLLNEAAEELKMDSPSSAANRGSPVRVVQHQSPPKNVQPSMTIRVQKRRSMDSDVSSSLSTLYSVDDEQEQREVSPMTVQSLQMQGMRPDDDPFVEKRLSKDFAVSEKRLSSWENQSLATDAAAFKKRKPTLEPVTVSHSSSEESQICPSACVSPLRPMSTIQTSQQRRGSIVSWLQPPDVEGAVPEVRKVSEESMVSVSVHSSSEDEAPSLDSSSSRTASPASRHRRRRDDDDDDEVETENEAEGFDEKDILAALLSSAGPKRALPSPPDHNLTPTKLSPPPKSHSLSRSPSIARSDDSSIYDQSQIIDPEELDFGTTVITTPNGHTRTGSVDVTTTISELRRMNSMVSSYSVASIASSNNAEDTAVMNLRGGGFSPERSGSVVARAGRRNYLSIGGSPNKRNSMGSRQSLDSHHSPQRPQGARHKRNKSSIGDKDAAVKVKAGIMMDSRKSPSVKSLRTQRRPARAQGVNLVEEIIAEEKVKRASKDSLGLYDPDGFYIGSPIRETHLRV